MTGICAECGNVATVLYEDGEGWVTPMCELCLEKIKSRSKDTNTKNEQTADK